MVRLGALWVEDRWLVLVVVLGLVAVVLMLSLLRERLDEAGEAGTARGPEAAMMAVGREGSDELLWSSRRCECRSNRRRPAALTLAFRRSALSLCSLLGVGPAGARGVAQSGRRSGERRRGAEKEKEKPPEKERAEVERKKKVWR